MPDETEGSDPSDEQVLATANRMVAALKSRNRLLKWVLAAAAVIIFAGGFFVWQLHKQNDDIIATQKATCVSGNDVRGQFDDKFASIADLLEAQTLASGKVIDENGEKFLGLLRERSTRRDC